MTVVTLGHDLLSLASLFFLEVVLGIDNLVFISIASAKLPKVQQQKAAVFGLLLALGARLLLLFGVKWIVSLQTPFFTVLQHGISGRDLLLGLGGLFLLFKGTQEIHAEIMEAEQRAVAAHASGKFAGVLLQIVVLDLIFSLDSVMTAIGMTQQYWIMVLAITLSIGVMIFANRALNAFITEHPSVKMLAISFLIMVGTVLIADAMHYHIPRGYIYFSIAFSLSVEALNIVRHRRRAKK